MANISTSRVFEAWGELYTLMKAAVWPADGPITVSVHLSVPDRTEEISQDCVRVLVLDPAEQDYVRVGPAGKDEQVFLLVVIDAGADSRTEEQCRDRLAELTGVAEAALRDQVTGQSVHPAVSASTVISSGVAAVVPSIWAQSNGFVGRVELRFEITFRI